MPVVTNPRVCNYPRCSTRATRLILFDIDDEIQLCDDHYAREVAIHYDPPTRKEDCDDPGL